MTPISIDFHFPSLEEKEKVLSYLSKEVKIEDLFEIMEPYEKVRLHDGRIEEDVITIDFNTSQTVLNDELQSQLEDLACENGDEGWASWFSFKDFSDLTYGSFVKWVLK